MNVHSEGSSHLTKVTVEWIGHAAVRVKTAEGPEVLFDPYESGGFDGRISYAPITCSPDVVAITHYHADHAHLTANMRSSRIVDGSCSFDGLEFRSLPAYHDGEGGVRMGLVRMLALVTDGLRIVHLGDLGSVPPRPRCRKIAPADLVLVPVGGNFTLNAREAALTIAGLDARLVVPIHYRTPSCSLPMAGVDDFVALCREKGWPVEERDGSCVRLPDDLPAKRSAAVPRVVILQPSHQRPVASR